MGCDLSPGYAMDALIAHVEGLPPFTAAIEGRIAQVQ